MSGLGRDITVDGLARLLGGRVLGDGSVGVDGIAPVDEAKGRQMAFLAAPRYVRHVDDCAVSAFLVSTELEGALPGGVTAVVVDDPYAALRSALEHFHPPAIWQPSIHPTAVVGRGVEFANDVEIGPYVVLEEGVRIGSGVRIGAHCVIGHGSSVGEGSRLYPHVVLYHDTVIGRNSIVHSGARLGADGFGYTMVDGEHAKIPQVGRLIVGDGVEIGANTTIDRGSLGDTVVEDGVKLDNLVHIAHNVKVGTLSLLAALVGIAGSTRIGKGVWFGGQSGAINQLEIGDGAKVTIQTGVMRDVPAEEVVSGTPSRPHREELRRQGGLGRLDRLRERVRELERRVAGLDEPPEGPDGTRGGAAPDGTPDADG